MDIQKCIDIARLLAKKLTGSITPEENQQLDEWRLADRRHQELADKLTDEKDYLVHQQELVLFPPAERWLGFRMVCSACSPRAAGGHCSSSG